MKEIIIDTQLFIQIIEAEDGIEMDYQDKVGDSVINYYKGKRGTISICITDEFLTNRSAKAHMRQLGIDDLIVGLFPTDDSGNPDAPSDQTD